MTCTYASKPISQCFPYGCPQTQQRTPTATYQTELADPGGGPTARRGRGTWEVAVVRPTPCCFLLSVGRFSPSACFSCLSSRRFVVLFVRPFVRRLCLFNLLLRVRSALPCVSVPEPCLGQSCTQAGGTGLLGGVWCNHKQVLAENRCRCTCAVAEPSGGMIRTGPISDHAAGQAALVVPEGDLVPVVLARLLFGMGQPLFTSCLGYRSALGALSASAL